MTTLLANSIDVHKEKGQYGDIVRVSLYANEQDRKDDKPMTSVLIDSATTLYKFLSKFDAVTDNVHCYEREAKAYAESKSPQDLLNILNNLIDEAFGEEA